MEGTLVDLAARMPSQGNSTSEPPIINGGQGGDLTPAEKLALAEKLLAEKEKGATGGTITDTTDPVEPPAEEIQAKLDEIAKKDEATYTDEDKALIAKYTPSDDDEITIVRKDIESAYNIKLEGTYDNGPEGLKAITREIAPILAEQMFYQALENVPHMKDFYDHVVTDGKSLETFLLKNSKPAFEGIELKETEGVEDEVQKEKLIGNQKGVLQMFYKSTGLDDATIDTLITLEEGKGTLLEKSKFALGELKKGHQAKIAAQLAQEEARITAEQEQIDLIRKQAEEFITKNDLGGVSIPEADIKIFKDALFKPIDQQGRTVIDYKRSKLTLQQRLLIDYLVLKDFKGIGLTKKTEAAVFSFKKAANENKDRTPKFGGVVNTDGKGMPQFSKKDIDFGNLMKQQ